MKEEKKGQSVTAHPEISSGAYLDKLLAEMFILRIN